MSESRLAKRETADHDDSGTWTAGEGDADEARYVLRVLRHLVRRSEGRLNSLTNDQAEGIVRLSRMCPDIPPNVVHLLASAYRGRSRRGMGTSDLDIVLAFAPWKESQLTDYLEALAGGRIPGVPAFVLNELLPPGWQLPLETTVRGARVPHVAPIPPKMAKTIADHLLGRSAEGIGTRPLVAATATPPDSESKP